MMASSPLQSEKKYDETDRVAFYISSRDAPGALSWKETLDKKRAVRYAQNTDETSIAHGDESGGMGPVILSEARICPGQKQLIRPEQILRRCAPQNDKNRRLGARPSNAK